MLCFSRLHSFLLMIDIPWYDSISVICFLIHRPLRCFQLGTITEVASGNLLGQIFSWTYVLVPLECRPSTETAGSWDGGLLTFMRNCQIAFQRDIYGNVWEFQWLQSLASTSILFSFYPSLQKHGPLVVSPAGFSATLHRPPLLVTYTPNFTVVISCFHTGFLPAATCLCSYLIPNLTYFRTVRRSDPRNST